MRLQKVLGLLLPLSLVPTSLWAQAWTPPRGELFFGVTYQWLEAENHLLSSDVLGAELTPLELLRGEDITSTVRDIGTVRSQVIVLDADFGLTDRLALTGGIAFVQSQYIGNEPEDPVSDDGTYHGNFQDARIGARYLVLNGSWLLTPFATFVFPTHDYDVSAHAALGRGLKELQVGASWGRILKNGRGAAQAYVSGAYFYAVMENPNEVIKLDRSNLQFELGWFHRSLTLQVFANYQNTHGGIDWVRDIGTHRSDLSNVAAAHDQAAAGDSWQLGGAVSFQVTDAVYLTAGLNNTLWGVNTHDANTVSFGLSYGFQAFGGIGSRSRPQDDGDKTSGGKGK